MATSSVYPGLIIIVSRRIEVLERIEHMCFIG